eukprot:1157230-Pelagomonas_calceolata.AAC.5
MEAPLDNTHMQYMGPRDMIATQLPHIRWDDKASTNNKLAGLQVNSMHIVKYAHKLVSTRRAIESMNNSHGQVLDPGASSNFPDPHKTLLFQLCGGGTYGSFKPTSLLLLN